MLEVKLETMESVAKNSGWTELLREQRRCLLAKMCSVLRNEEMNWRQKSRECSSGCCIYAVSIPCTLSEGGSKKTLQLLFPFRRNIEDGKVAKIKIQWRRKGVGLRGFRQETESSIDDSEDEDILKVFRKEKVDGAIDEAVSRVLGMVDFLDADQQYHRNCKTVPYAMGMYVLIIFNL
ncbi:hypothetical protein QYF36_006179 [Acer negundo]|nr:hypothetical protein QYF36_006179 [Acer negundo]